MKKSLLFGLLFSTAVMLHAQNASNPLTLEIGGENKYEYAGGYSTPVYKYVAPEDQLITLTTNQDNATFTVSTNNTSWGTKAVGYNTKNYSKFIIEKDKEVYIFVNITTSPLTIDAKAVEQPYNLA